METENDVKQYFETYRYAEEYGSEEDGWALLAARQLYDETGEEPYASFIRKYFELFVTQNGDMEDKSAGTDTAGKIHAGRCLFFLYQNTGEEKYRKAIETLMNCLRTYFESAGGCAASDGQPEDADMETLYRTAPFYMEYETVYDKKEKYQDIIKRFECAQEIFSNGKKDRCCMSAAQYLAALVDTMDCMSIEIYEQYRKLQDMFKLALGDVLRYRDRESGLFPRTFGPEDQGGSETDLCGSALIGYCILKACRMGIVLREKYIDTGMEVVEKLVADMEEQIKKGGRMPETQILLMAYGQYLHVKNRSEE